MTKHNQKNTFHENIKHLENFIKKYENALTIKSKDLRLTIEEASLIVSAITKILLINHDNKEEEKSSEKKENKETIKIDLDFGFFKKK